MSAGVRAVASRGKIESGSSCGIAACLSTGWRQLRLSVCCVIRGGTASVDEESGSGWWGETLGSREGAVIVTVGMSRDEHSGGSSPDVSDEEAASCK